MVQFHKKGIKKSRLLGIDLSPKWGIRDELSSGRRRGIFNSAHPLAIQSVLLIPARFWD
jgi:hypothetical protein